MDLKKVCLNNICSNLYLNYKICKKLSIKIPSSIGQLIFNNSFKIVCQFNRNDLKLFKKEIINLRKINLEKKQFENVRYYDFLNGHYLDELRIGYIDKFIIENNDFQLYANNIIIKYYDSGESNELLKKCYIKKSITIRSDFQIIHNYFPLIKLIENSNDNLKILRLHEINSSIFKHKQFNRILKKRTKIEKFSIIFQNDNINCLKRNNGLFKNFKPLIYLRETLKQNYCKNLLEIFKYMPNLTSIYLYYPYFNEKTINELFKFIKEKLSMKLIEFHFIFDDLTDKNIENLKETLNYCEKLNSITIGLKSNNYSIDANILNSLMPCTKYLIDFDILFQNFTNYDNQVEKFLINCSNLTKFDLKIPFKFKLESEIVNEALELSKNTINLLDFSYCSISVSQLMNINFPSIENLQEINMVGISFRGNSMEILFDALQHLAVDLKSFRMEIFSVDILKVNSFVNFLSKCTKLQKIIIIQKSTGDVLEKILLSLDSCSETLQKIEFRHFRTNDKQIVSIIPLLKKFNNLEKLNLCLLEITDFFAISLIRMLKNCSNSIKSIKLNFSNLSDMAYRQMNTIAETIPTLQRFDIGGRH